MSRRVIVKSLQQIDMKRMIGCARKQLYGKGRIAAANENSYGLGYYCRKASLEPRTDKGIPCHKCRLFISLGEPFARKICGGKTIPCRMRKAVEPHIIIVCSSYVHALAAARRQ